MISHVVRINLHALSTNHDAVSTNHDPIPTNHDLDPAPAHGYAIRYSREWYQSYQPLCQAAWVRGSNQRLRQGQKWGQVYSQALL